MLLEYTYIVTSLLSSAMERFSLEEFMAEMCIVHTEAYLRREMAQNVEVN